MRKVVFFVAASLDGYIARNNGSIDWLFSDQDYGYSEFYQTIDTALMGRTTYEVSIGFGEYPFPGLETFVFSRTKAGTRDENATFTDADSGELIQELRNRPGKNIWLVGGAGLSQSFLELGLIDEFVISIHPITLGSGIPLFTTHRRETKLTLKNKRAFSSGLIQLTYERIS